MIEKTVIHKQYGSGIVQRERLNGFELYILFSDGVSRWVRYNDVLQKFDRHQQAKPKRFPPDERFPYRTMVEAFRLGIVPYDKVMDFTFGREREVEVISKWLDNKVKSSLFVIGNYGTGKSHLLAYVAEAALREGYAVASLEVDDNEATFARPKLIYRYIVKSLKFIENGEKKGFREFVSKAVKSDMLKDHAYLKNMKDCDEDFVWRWIEGNISGGRTNYYQHLNSWLTLSGLHEHATAANIFCYILSGLGWAAKKILGLKGLLIIFDESENLFQINSSYHWYKADNFLNALIRTANSERKLLNERVWETGLGYSGYASSIPFLYKNTSGMKLIFGFTPNYYLENLSLQIDGIKKLEIEHLDDAALLHTYLEICRLYQQAYNWNSEGPGYSKIKSCVDEPDVNMRRFVKCAVETFDVGRFGTAE
jgi:hypothetical protein